MRIAYRDPVRRVLLWSMQERVVAQQVVAVGVERNMTSSVC